MVVSLPRHAEFDAGAAPRAGHFLLRGQEKVTKEKAARRLAATRYPALLIISGPFVQLARQKTPRSNMHSLSPEMTAMLGCVHGGWRYPGDTNQLQSLSR